MNRLVISMANSMTTPRMILLGPCEQSRHDADADVQVFAVADDAERNDSAIMSSTASGSGQDEALLRTKRVNTPQGMMSVMITRQLPAKNRHARCSASIARMYCAFMLHSPLATQGRPNSAWVRPAQVSVKLAPTSRPGCAG